MSIELSQVQGHIKDEIVKLKGQFSLDINLERGRAIEAVSIILLLTDTFSLLIHLFCNFM